MAHVRVLVVLVLIVKIAAPITSCAGNGQMHHFTTYYHVVKDVNWRQHKNKDKK